ncbi:hypothetical protein AVEN_98446-1 [Araneus ventricosus]|uniref:Transposase Tc1-like domain-containing protein n=1 Tax=Araneus ventricosus TaxID=182803 RepID=A0A4Y2LAQ1_ARAVE|nr:hypothetical protein AVEN_98446-1 [Araneus ventricosus]
MEMGLIYADADRRRNVSSLRVVQGFWGQSHSENSVLGRLVTDRPRVATPAEDSFFALSARRRRRITVSLAATGTRISATTVRRHLHNHGLMQEDHLCAFLSIDDREVPVYVGQKSRLFGPDSNGPQYSSQMSQDLL